MSGVRTQGVGLAASARAAVGIVASATVITRVRVENLFILHAPNSKPSAFALTCACPLVFEHIPNIDVQSIRRRDSRAVRRSRVWDFRMPRPRICSEFKSE